MGVDITVNDVLADGNKGLSDSELTKALRNRQIVHNYKSKVEISRRTKYTQYTGARVKKLI